MPFDGVMDGWSVSPLRNLTIHIARGAAPSYTAKQTSVWAVSQKCVRDGSFALDHCKSHQPAKSVAKTAYLRDGDICINSTGTGTLGRVALWRDAPGRYFADTHITIVRPDAMQIDPAFLATFLGMPSTREVIYRECVTGSTNQIELSKTAFGSLTIPLPALDEQRRIANVLRSVDEAICSAQAVAEAARQSSRVFRHQLLRVSADGEVGDLPADWELCPLASLAVVERGKFSVRPRNDPRYFDGDTPFIQTGDITSAGDYLVGHTQTLNDLGVGVSRVFPTGTILTTIAANIGDFAISAYPVACPDSVVGIQVNAGLQPFWLYAALTCFKKSLDKASTQNAQKNINLQTLRPLLIPTPPPDLMSELADILEAAGFSAQKEQEQVEKLKSIKRLIAEDLFSGRVRVPQ